MILPVHSSSASYPSVKLSGIDTFGEGQEKSKTRRLALQVDIFWKHRGEERMMIAMARMTVEVSNRRPRDEAISPRVTLESLTRCCDIEDNFRNSETLLVEGQPQSGMPVQQHSPPDYLPSRNAWNRSLSIIPSSSTLPVSFPCHQLLSFSSSPRHVPPAAE